MRTLSKRLAGAALLALALVIGCSNANLVGGRNYVSQGVYDKAVEVLENAVVEMPGSAEAHFLLGKSYAETGRHEKAPAELARAAELDPSFYALRGDTVRSAFYAKLFNAGNELLNAGQYTEAADRYVKAAAYSPNEVGVHQNLGFVYAKLDRQEDAIAEYKKMYEIDPKNIAALKTVLAMLTEAGEREKAIAICREIRSANPSDLQATGTLAEMYMEDAEAAKERKDDAAAKAAMDQAIPLFETIAQADPSSAGAAYQLGIAHFTVNDFARASERFEKVTELTEPKDPLHIDALSNLVASLYKMAQYAKAEMHLYTLIPLEPEECGNYRLLSGALREQSKNAQALDAAKKYEECKGR